MRAWDKIGVLNDTNVYFYYLGTKHTSPGGYASVQQRSVWEHSFKGNLYFIFYRRVVIECMSGLLAGWGSDGNQLLHIIGTQLDGAQQSRRRLWSLTHTNYFCWAIFDVDGRGALAKVGGGA